MNKYINFLKLEKGKLTYNYNDATAIMPFKELIDSSLEYFCAQKDFEVFNSDTFYTKVLDSLSSKKSFVIEVEGKYFDLSDILLGYLSSCELEEPIAKDRIELFLNKELVKLVSAGFLTDKQVRGVIFNFLLVNQFTKLYILEVLGVKIKDSVFSNIGFNINCITSEIMKALDNYINEEQEDSING